MSQRIILAPTLNSNELIRNLALHGVNSFNLQVFSSGEFARYVLMRSGVTVSSDFLDSKEEIAIVASVIKGEAYFGNSSYSDTQALTYAIRRMRMLVDADDEERAIEETIKKGLFKEKNAALVSVYKKYAKYLADHKLIDFVSLIRMAISCCGVIDAEFCVLSEYQLSPLEKKLIDRVSGGKYKTTTLAELYNASGKPITIESIKNCYGGSNEVESIIADIYSGKKLDQCTVAITDISTYGQLFFDNSMLYNIPLTFGCGLPIINSNPARLLVLYNHWMTSGFFGTDAINKMVFSASFNRSKLKETLLSEGDDIKWSDFYQYLGDIKLTNNYERNKEIVEAYKDAVDKESKYIVEGESKEYDEFLEKQKCIPLLEKMAEELSLPVEIFISKYAYIRHGNKSCSDQLVSALDKAALGSIYEELKVVRESGSSQSEGDIIQNILKMNVLTQNSEPGHIHITSIDKAMCTIRENMYIAGLSSSKYPGSPKENHLLLDADIKLFGIDAEYLTSDNRIKRKRNAVITLAELASSLGSKLHLSYSGLIASELKHDNASSMVYVLYGKSKGGMTTAKDLEDATVKVGYFDPAISSSRFIGNAYIDEKCIDQKNVEYDRPEAGWNIDKEYSPTAIENFMGCPRSFMLDRILGIPSPDDDDAFEVMSARDFGILAHSLMEQLANNTMTLEEFLKLSGEFFNRYIDQHTPLITEKVSAKRDSFLEMMENAYKTDPHMKVILKEEDIHCVHSSGVKLRGFPDRVEELEDGSLLIVDYKTGTNIKHKKDDINTCLQVLIYAYLMESKGYKVSGGEYRYIRAKTNVTCRYDDEMKAKLSEKLELFKDMMLNGEFPCGYACEYCKFTDICEWQLDGMTFGTNVLEVNDAEGEEL